MQSSGQKEQLVPSKSPVNDARSARTPKPAHLRPLIPESVLDLSSQRLSIVSLFVLIQGWKLYDLYLIKNDDLREILHANVVVNFLSPEWNFIFKYMFLDGLIVWLNSVLRIPKLAFKPLFSIAIILVLYAITILLTLDFKFSVTVLFSSLLKQAFPEKELAVAESYVDSTSLDQSAHFKGKKTIRFLPDSSIKLNPFGQNFCLSSESRRSKIKVPIKYNSSSELEYLQILHTNFDNEVSTLNFTRRELKRFMTGSYFDSNAHDDRVSYMELEFSEPGYYKIQQALDMKYKNIRNYKSDLIVPRCPQAYFSEFEKIQDICVDDELENLSISVTGVPPLTLVYEEEVNGELSNLPNSIIVPDESGFHSPLLSRDFYTGKSSLKGFNFQHNDLKDLSWACSRSIDVPLATRKIDRSGDLIFTISKIIDGFGNIVEYTPTPPDRFHYYKLKSHPIPVIHLVDPKPAVPILVGERKHIDLKITQPAYPSAEAPYTVNMKFTPADGSEPEFFSKTFDPRKPAPILADKPGTYTLESAFSKFCSCRIGSSSVSVLYAKLPEVEITSNPIVDNCVGTTGFKFNFEFIGNGPFEIAYKVLKLEPHETTKDVGVLRTDSTVYEFNYKPPTEGSYAIEFLSLSDKYYKKQVTFTRHEHRYVTYFKKRPKAFFTKDSNVQKLNVCNGQAANVTLHLEGKAPYKVTYDLISPDYKVQTFKLDDITENQLEIGTSSFDKGGDYVLLLKDVTDASNCGIDFRGQEVHINVRKEVPTLSFTKEAQFKLIQGRKLTVPLKAESSSLIDLKYKHTSLDGSKEQIEYLRFFNPVDGFPVFEEGVYELLEFSQGGCPGKISNALKISASYLPKPSLQLVKTDLLKEVSPNTYIKEKLCEKSASSIEFRATGVPPFVIEYSIKFPSGLIEDKTEQLSNKNFAIHPKTSESGDYEYIIKGIYDSIYTTEILNDLVRKKKYSFDDIRIEHTVSPLPSAMFVNRNEHYQTCVSSIGRHDLLQPIPIALSGEAPFEIQLAVYHEQEDRHETMELKNIQTHKVDLLAVYEKLRIGSHSVSIFEVKDGNGCSSSDFEKEEVVIQVNDVPKIRHLVDDSMTSDNQLSKQVNELESNYYCVGDHISYLLSGMPPFTVYYEFNNRKQRVEVNSNYFKRRASAEGTMSVLALSDSSSKNCLVNYTASASGSVINERPDLNAKIYDLPSVEITQGDEIEEDIHEGDNVEIIFRFVGHPPFKLTYVRMDLAEPERIVETEVVENIFDHEYRIWAKLEGIYEAIEVQDAYCVARNHR